MPNIQMPSHKKKYSDVGLVLLIFSFIPSFNNYLKYLCARHYSLGSRKNTTNQNENFCPSGSSCSREEANSKQHKFIKA